jgi:hypothetical protein
MSTNQPDITKFYTAATVLGFGRKYNFQVEAIDGLPGTVQGLVNGVPDYLLYVQTAKVPSRKVNTTRVPYKAFEYVVPTNVSFPDNESWELEFISDNDVLIRSLFEEWNRVLYDNTTNISEDTNFAKSKLVLNLLSEQYNSKAANVALEAKKVYTLYGIFPTVINSMQYSMADNGSEVAKFRVTMAFQFYTAVDINAQVNATLSAPNADLYNNAFAGKKLNDTLQSTNSIVTNPGTVKF